MAQLEKITTGSVVTGIAGKEPVNVVAVKWHGGNVLTVTFKDAGGLLADQLLYRED